MTVEFALRWLSYIQWERPEDEKTAEEVIKTLRAAIVPEIKQSKRRAYNSIMKIK